MKSIPKETILKYTQTAGERNEIDEILEPVLLAQRIYGLQILDPEWTWKKYGIYRIVSFTLAIYISLGTIDVCAKSTDLNVIMEGIFTTMINTQMVFKILLFASLSKKFQANYVQAKSYIYNLVKESPTKRRIVIRNVKISIKLLFFCIFCPVASYFLIALWFAFSGNRVTLSRSTSSLMPMTSPYYELGLMIHLYYLIEASFCLLVVDLYYVLICIFYFAASDVSVDMLDVKKNGDNDDLYAKRLDESLRRFYVLHVQMMKYMTRFNDMYKWISLVPITAIIIQNCIFLMLLMEEINFQLGAVMLPANAELITYNWFGEQVKSTAVKINMALLHFDWTSMKVKDQKKYFIITCYMNKEFGLRTAFGNDLSLLTLSSIYKASYQMFTVFSTT